MYNTLPFIGDKMAYTVYPAKIKTYFDKFQEVGIPDKVDRKWLASLGFKGGNDYYIIRVLQALEFIDDSNVPTELWKRYKDTIIAPKVLAEGIRKGYSDLFDVYKDADKRDREALYAYFSSKTGKAKATVNYMVNTFINLCELAEFEEAPKPEKKKELPTARKLEAPHIPIPERGVTVPEIHINIQLHLPETSDMSVYDALFESLKKHILSGK